MDWLLYDNGRRHERVKYYDAVDINPSIFRVKEAASARFYKAYPGDLKIITK